MDIWNDPLSIWNESVNGMTDARIKLTADEPTRVR